MTVGFRTGLCFDEMRQAWGAEGPRPLAWSAWYPADFSSASTPSKPSWFRLGPIAHNAALRSADRPYPLVLLSHGSGATAAAMDWLAHRLAQQGYVALALDHHGHTGSEAFHAAGFLCLWERARDFSALLDDRSWRVALAEPIDTHASVAGFSAGAYTAMQLIGARVAYSQFEPDNPVKSSIRGPREFPDLVDEFPKLQTNAVFREAWDRRREDYSDPRVRHATVIAPGRSVTGFSIDSLQGIRNPVQMFAGDADTVAPPEQCCRWLNENVPGSEMELLTGGVGHYTFLPEGSEIGVRAAYELFNDVAGVERRAIHNHVADRTARFPTLSL